MSKKLIGNPRDAALEVLLEVHKNQAYSNLLVSRKIKEYKLEGPDRGLMTELAYGTLQHQTKLDFLLAPFIKGKMEAWVRILLRLSVYQLVFLDRIPEHAVVNEAVVISKKRGHKGISGLVNGVLRSFLRVGPRSTDSIADPLKRLAVETSHPEWLLKEWIDRYGFDRTREIAEQNNTAPPQTIRINTVKLDRDAAIATLEQEGFTVRKGIVEECLHVSGKPAASSELFKQGMVTIQDESSMLPAHTLQLEEGLDVLDMCAAPGGKSTHIAQLMSDKGTVLALDLHQHKVKLIRENAERLGLTSIEPIVGDAREASELVEGKLFDRILIDAPCSGYGVIRRKPDMKYTKQPTDAARLAEIQLAILNEAYNLLKPGGTIVYSTCTIEPAENQQVVQAFLADHQDMETTELPGILEKLPHLSEGPGIQILPYADGDGFYLAALTKRGN